MRSTKFLATFSAVVLLAGAGQRASALTVLAPPIEGADLMAGEDFATQVIANAWDMDSDADIQLAESQNLISQGIGGGMYSATAATNDPYFFLLNLGVPSAVPTHNGHRYPIDTTRYRYLTARIRVGLSGGGVIPAGQRAFQAYFYRDQNSIVDGTVGCSPFAYYGQDEWQIVTVDMQALPACGPYTMAWTTYSKLEGLRIDPVAAANAHMEIDWIRLTAPPSSPLQSYMVQWSDTSVGHAYTINAVDDAGTRLSLASSVSGTSYSVDMTRLPAGNYRIEVLRNGAVSLSPGALRVNAVPQATIHRPNIRGDQARNYALVETGNAWGPIDSGDILSVFNITNVSYGNPVGSFSGRATSDDPYIFFAATSPIDAQKYRSLCYTMQIHGERDIGLGSVARVMWGQHSSILTTTDDIVVNAGLNEVCLPDLAEVPDEGAAAGPWTGIQNYIRIDPHEFPVSSACAINPSPSNCRDIRIESFVLSPFFEANPGFQFQWELADEDGTSSLIRIYLDPDLDPYNGNWTLIATVSASVGTGSYHWPGGGMSPGRYNVFIEADDGVNVAGSYAGGPLLVTSGSDLIFADGFQVP